MRECGRKKEGQKKLGNRWKTTARCVYTLSWIGLFRPLPVPHKIPHVVSSSFFLLRPDQVAIVQPENCTADLHDLHGDLFGPVQPRPECESLLLRLLPERRHVGDTFWKCYLLTVCSAPLSACAGSFLFTLHLPDARPDPRPANLSGCSGGVVSIQVRGVVSDGFFHCKLGIHC